MSIDVAATSSEANSSSAKDNVETIVAIRRRVARNVSWNWAGVCADVIVGFLLAPFLIVHLGDSVYGMWILIGSLTGYVGRLDFGFRGAVGRFVAFYSGRDDQEGVIYSLNAAAAVLAVLGTVAFGLVALIAYWLDSLLTVPEDQLYAAQVALVIVGGHLGLFLVFRVFDATLWGYQRFDLLNIVDIPASFIQSLLSALVVYRGFGLVGLAWVTLTMTVAVGVAKLALSLRQTPFLRFSPQLFRWEKLRELANFGIWNSMVSITSTAGRQLAPIVVGATLGLAVVTSYSVARRLVVYAFMVLTSSIGVLVPLASQFHAQGDSYRQRQLFLRGGTFCLSIALMFYALFAFLGGALLSLWIGEPFRSAWWPLMMLATGDLLPMSAEMSKNTIQGMAKHRPLAWRGLADAIVGLGLGGLLAQHWGLVGFCAGLGFSRAWFSGIFVLIYGCRLVHVPLSQYLGSTVLPVIVTALIPIGALGLLTSWRPVTSWIELFVFGSGFVAVYWLFVMHTAFSRQEIQMVIDGVLRRLRFRSS